MDLVIEHSTEREYDVLAPRGELDVSNYAQLRGRIGDLITAGKVNLVLDLSETEFMDSTALGALIGGRRKAYAAGGSLTVVCSRPQLQKLFQITKLDVVFTIFPTMEAWRAKVGLPA